MRVRITEAEAKRLRAQGVPLPEAKPKRFNRKELAPEMFAAPPAFKVGPLVFVFPVATASETNVRAWKAKNARSRDARRTVCPILGKRLRYLVPFAEAFHAGLPVYAKFVRLGGKNLDAMANLGAALKAVEDAVAHVLGADDGSGNWVVSSDQMTDWPRVGVAVILHTEPLPLNWSKLVPVFSPLCEGET